MSGQAEDAGDTRGGQRFGIRYGVLRPLLTVLGVGPAAAGVHLGEREVSVRMGWAFRARFPVSSIQRATRGKHMFGPSIGAHGWRGQWLVNGSVKGIVTLDLQPETRARVAGMSFRLHQLHVSLVDPDGFLAAIEARGRGTRGS